MKYLIILICLMNIAIVNSQPIGVYSNQKSGFKGSDLVIFSDGHAVINGLWGATTYDSKLNKLTFTSLSKADNNKYIVLTHNEAGTLYTLVENTGVHISEKQQEKYSQVTSSISSDLQTILENYLLKRDITLTTEKIKSTIKQLKKMVTTKEEKNGSAILTSLRKSKSTDELSKLALGTDIYMISEMLYAIPNPSIDFTEQELNNFSKKRLIKSYVYKDALHLRTLLLEFEKRRQLHKQQK